MYRNLNIVWSDVRNRRLENFFDVCLQDLRLLIGSYQNVMLKELITCAISLYIHQIWKYLGVEKVITFYQKRYKNKCKLNLYKHYLSKMFSTAAAQRGNKFSTPRLLNVFSKRFERLFSSSFWIFCQLWNVLAIGTQKKIVASKSGNYIRFERTSQAKNLNFFSIL